MKNKEENIWFHGNNVLCVWQSKQTHVDFIYTSKLYAGFKAEKHKIYKYKHVISFSRDF